MSNTKLESIDVFMPEYCVQGERIPFYFLWDTSNKINVSIVLPDGISLEEIYNVNSENLKSDNNVWNIDHFETDGYIGGVLGSMLYDQATVTKKIKFQITLDSGIIQTFEKQIELFRPDVKIDDSTETIQIRKGTNSKPIVQGHIKISNHGKGTAFIRINLLPDSDIKEGEPIGFEEFKIKFLDDLNASFLNLKSKFPQYDELVDSLILVSKNPLPSKSEDMDVVRNTVEELEKALANNEDFLSEFSRGIVTAYLKNVSIMTDADAFLAFLKSLGKNKLIIIDSMKVFKVLPGTHVLLSELITTDLAQNTYPNTKLQPITIISDGAYDLPFYQILDSSGVS